MLRILANTALPEPDGFAIRHFGHYPDPRAAQPWRAEMERRNLSDILPLIPAAEKPDVLLISHPEYLPIPYDIASFRGPKVLLITDWNVCLRFLPDLCPLFDFCFTDWPGYKLLSGAGVRNVRHQPLFGHDPRVFRPLGLSRDLDVSFCGNRNGALHGERNRLVERLARWGEARGRPIHLQQAFGEAYIGILNRSRLVFNYSIRGEANMRLFESMACGAVPLVEEGNLEVPLLFREGEHYFSYAPNELESKIESLLAEPERIAAVAQAAAREVAKHAKIKQVAALLGTVAGGGSASRTAGSNPAASIQSLKALAKMRVLGAGFTLPEALAELRGQSGRLPGLESETLPGILLTLLQRNPGQALETVRNALMGYLDSGLLPKPLELFFRMREAETRENWAAMVKWSEALMASMQGAEEAAYYGFFHAPIELGRALNANLNLAFQSDLAPGSRHGYSTFLKREAALGGETAKGR